MPNEGIDEQLLDFIELKTRSAAGVDYFSCINCSYSLLGNQTGTCSECGTAIPFSKMGLSPERFQELSRRMTRHDATAGTDSTGHA